MKRSICEFLIVIVLAILLIGCLKQSESRCMDCIPWQVLPLSETK
jgi:hypothetical protein